MDVLLKFFAILMVLNTSCKTGNVKDIDSSQEANGRSSSNEQGLGLANERGPPYNPVLQIQISNAPVEAGQSSSEKNLRINESTGSVLKTLTEAASYSYDIINDIQPNDRHIRDENFLKSGVLNSRDSAGHRLWSTFPITTGIESDKSIDAIPAVIFYNKNDNEIIISFHGTRSGDLPSASNLSGTEGWTTNTNDTHEVLKFSWQEGVEYNVHGAFKRKMDGIIPQIEDVLDVLIKESGSIPRIMITGHSQGGAIANVAALYVDNYLKGIKEGYDNAKERAIFLYGISPAVICMDEECRDQMNKTLGAINILEQYDRSDPIVRFEVESLMVDKLAAAKQYGDPSKLLPGYQIIQNTDETLKAAGVSATDTASDKLAASHFGSKHKLSEQHRRIFMDPNTKQFREAASQQEIEVGFDKNLVDVKMEREGTVLLSPHI